MPRIATAASPRSNSSKERHCSTPIPSPPYNFDWTNVAAGTYTLTARATDNLGSTTTSAGINITVTAAPMLYYIHPDHLNTPRVITNQAQQIVWRWDNDDPFGGNMANENPSGLGTFTCNLRFPGQYFDRETNMHYNYFRDYLPEIGRYVESDPIGLKGGINTYGYVGGSPIALADPHGLAGGSVYPTKPPSTYTFDPLAGLMSYMMGGGAPVNVPFSQINTSSIDPIFFQGFLTSLGGSCVSRTIPISDTRPFGTSGLNAAVLGNVTLVLNGVLTTNCDCTWSFSGNLSAGPDPYNFNKSTHRSALAEASVTVGRNLPGTPYTMNYVGQSPMQASGKMQGTPTCCQP
jgi:RHS repeat-associated protein